MNILCQEPSGWWESVQCVAHALVPIVQIFSLIGLIAYVAITYRTLGELKRQTDLANRGFLVVKPRYINAESLEELKSKVAFEGRRGRAKIFDAASYFEATNYRIKVDSKTESLSKKWKDILANNIEKATEAPQRYLVLELINRGRSDIVRWRIDLDLAIRPSEYLVAKINSGGERANWTVRSGELDDDISPDQSLNIVVAPVGFYPDAGVSWSLQYVDMLNGTHVEFGGSRKIPIRNPLAHLKSV